MHIFCGDPLHLADFGLTPSSIQLLSAVVPLDLPGAAMPPSLRRVETS